MKFKKTKPMPPLSVLDQIIYWLVFLVLCCFWFGLIMLIFWLRGQIAFADSEVTAYHEHASLLWFLLPWCVIFLGTFTPWVVALEARRPIFGRKDWKYGQQNYPKVYPLFMKNKPRGRKQQRLTPKLAVIGLAALLILVLCGIPMLLSLYGRDCLLHNGTVVEYSMFNTAKAFSPNEIERITIEPYRYTTGRYGTTTHWGVRMVFVTESGREYKFDHRDFRKDKPGEITYWLASMTQLKARYDPAIIHYQDMDLLEHVRWDCELSEAEWILLQQLFE